MQTYVDQVQEQSGEVAEPDTAGRPVTMTGIFRIPDPMWERIAPLIPAPVKVHRFGGGAPRIADRVVFDAIFFVLRTGCQWHALDATGICSGATAHRVAARPHTGAFRSGSEFAALWEQALEDYDQEVGIDWSFMPIDGSMGKARWEAGVQARTRPIAASSASNAA